MARPRGQFDANKERCYQLVLQLSKYGPCFATNAYLGTRLDCCTKQIQRYLNSLELEGRLSLKTQKPKTNPDGSYYSKRLIEISRVQRSEP